MKTRILTCAVCENHCRIEAQIEDGEVLDVSGNRCMKGFIFAQQEAENLENENE